MHPFSELVMRCTALTEGLMEERRTSVLEAFRESASTSSVKAIQAIELQNAIVAVGIVAMFDAALQDALNCENGFREAERLLERAGELELRDRFMDVQRAVNVLKHGRGRSYDELAKRQGQLPFHIRVDGEFFDEGDISEVATLVRADGEFLRYCSDTVDLVAALIRRTVPTAWI